MSISRIFIPQKLRVGFCARKDTFSKKLAYLIYYDENGKLRKEKSFNSWIDKSIPVEEMDNVPQKGFILNKDITRYSSYANNGSKFRIYDSRGFEFEITADNFIAISQHSNMIAQELTQECVYGWEGSELILIPTNSEVYQQALKNSQELENRKDVAKSLVVGRTYRTKTQDGYIYLGRKVVHDLFPQVEKNRWRGVYTANAVKRSAKKDVFYHEISETYVFLSKSSIVACTDDLMYSKFSIIEENFERLNTSVQNVQPKLVLSDFNEVKKNKLIEKMRTKMERYIDKEINLDDFNKVKGILSEIVGDLIDGKLVTNDVLMSDPKTKMMLIYAMYSGYYTNLNNRDFKFAITYLKEGERVTGMLSFDIVTSVVKKDKVRNWKDELLLIEASKFEKFIDYIKSFKALEYMIVEDQTTGNCLLTKLFDELEHGVWKDYTVSNKKNAFFKKRWSDVNVKHSSELIDFVL